MSNTEIASIKNIIDNSLWDKAISVIGKFMGNEKIYTNSLQDIYQAEQQYKKMQVEIEQLDEKAETLQKIADDYKLKTAAIAHQLKAEPSVKSSGANKRLLVSREANYQYQLNEIKKVREQASALASQSVASIYESMIAHKKPNPAEDSATYSDYKYFTRSLHYNFSTSNRDAVGKESTAAIDAFCNHKLGPMADITYKLLNIYSALNNAAAAKEKCLSTWANPVNRADLLKYTSEAKHRSYYQKEPFKLIEYLQGKHEDIFGKKTDNERVKGLLDVYVAYLHEARKQLIELIKIIRKTCANRKITSTLTPDEHTELMGYQRVLSECLLECKKEIRALKNRLENPVASTEESIAVRNTKKIN